MGLKPVERAKAGSDGYWNRLKAGARWDRYPTSFPKDGPKHISNRLGFRPKLRLLRVA